MTETTITGIYGFRSSRCIAHASAFLPPLFELCGQLLRPGARVLDVGCGNGYTAGQLLARGCDVVGIDLSESGIALARKTYPRGRFEVLPADEIFSQISNGAVDVVVSTEVIEHLYSRAYVAGCYKALRPGGGVRSTPYHGYLKNLFSHVEQA